MPLLTGCFPAGISHTFGEFSQSRNHNRLLVKFSAFYKISKLFLGDHDVAVGTRKPQVGQVVEIAALLLQVPILRELMHEMQINAATRHAVYNLINSTGPMPWNSSHDIP